MNQTVPEGRLAGPRPASPDPVGRALDALATERAGLDALTDALTKNVSGLRDAFEAVTDRIAMCVDSGGGRLVVTGIGKSGHIGRKIQSTMASTGTPSLFIHPAEASHGDLGMIQRHDVVLALSRSGETTELADIVAYTRRQGVCLMAMTSRPDSTLATTADHHLCLPGAPEACPMGLAPTTSCLMQLALGDALAIVLLERRRFSARDFGTFHPGGRLGASLRLVRDLMHGADAMPLGASDMPLSGVILEMTRKAFGCMGVVDADGALIGLITDADLRGALDRDLSSTRASDVMNPRPLTVSPDILAPEALRFMNERRKPITSVFVLDEHRRPLGILHVHDLLRAGVV
ncbi:arabinose-5-phosphate isomerase GutQ [Ameyamaea chiangmaiensis NBRC 103196]|uniref:KpsF/GutQ family sugar-phosphate isomerase n=1 Tax=Ameyamaea chiangmaiensis TaxID=442969 RepID=A0A850PBQ8_9PROT|nr:KpsF/GutQ family sugar-phosphate isomerase [Ameyamaea chiangmaiensis]MBS4073903.1 KpsF/GutQ family sugar-phosphate isomerase [Ameyamaea chiangmaiensis]NVN40363.1 KpsF/GutQ family sugar-phosphate isomerase [Ameyamaea chiangmaiensis]GBQ67997.1 arabinose-5-phosphate isomerase GutQ [Ameyamaea chiangmaiensis NBRC 103196]